MYLFCVYGVAVTVIANVLVNSNLSLVHGKVIIVVILYPLPINRHVCTTRKGSWIVPSFCTTNLPREFTSNYQITHTRTYAYTLTHHTHTYTHIHNQSMFYCHLLENSQSLRTYETLGKSYIISNKIKKRERGGGA